MLQKKKVGILLSVFIMLGMLAKTSHAGIISLTPSSQSVQLGTPVVFDIFTNFPGSDPLQGGRMNIDFDSSILSFVSLVMDTSPLLTGNTTNPTLLPGRLENFGFGTLAFSGLAGPIHIAQITFNTIGVASGSPLTMSEYGLGFYSAATFSQIDPTFANASVAVSAIPEPATVLLISSGFIGMLCYRGRREES